MPCEDWEAGISGWCREASSAVGLEDRPMTSVPCLPASHRPGKG
jgi:hypothetical protein